MQPEPEGLPPYLSVSQITTYLGCPRKYRFRYVERREPESRSADLGFGSAVHSAIEWYFTERIAGRAPAEDAVLRIFRADWTSQLADPLLDCEDEKPEGFQVLGEALVKLFLGRFESEPPPEQAETRFEVPLRDPRTGETLPVPLVGYLDFASDGVVGELKTAAKRTAASNWSMQLAAYSYAVRELSGRRPCLKVVVLVKTKTPAITVEDLTLTDREEAWFLEVASETFDAIQRGAFFPNPGWMCARCEYRRACRGS